MQAVQEQKQRLGVARGFHALVQLFRKGSEQRGYIPDLDHLEKRPHDVGQAGQELFLGRLQRTGGHQGERWAGSVRLMWGKLAAQAQQSGSHHAEGGFSLLADHEEVGAALPPEHRRRGVFDGDGFPQPGGQDRRGRRGRIGFQTLLQLRVLVEVGRGGPFEDNLRAGGGELSFPGESGHAAQRLIAALIGQPNDLEQVIALEEPAGGVVDGFAGPGQEPRCRVVLAENEMSIGLAALQGDADGHLVDGAAGQAVSASQGLRAEQDMNAEGASLPDQPIQKEGGFLGGLVILDKKFLEFVDDEQDARHGLLAVVAGMVVAIGIQVVDAALAEAFAAGFELDVEPLQDAEAELALTFDRHHAGMGQLVDGVGLELDAFLEVDEVEFHFIRAVGQGHLGDEGVQQGGFAGAGLAADEGMLGGPLAQL